MDESLITFLLGELTFCELFRVPEATDIKLQEKSGGARGRESTERRRQLYSHRHKPQLIAGRLRGVAKTRQVSKVDVMGILKWVL